jgi:hypothetical protein
MPVAATAPLRVEPLEEKHDRAAFTCGVDVKGKGAAAFYARYRFLPLAQHGCRLFVPMAGIAKLFA